MMICESCLLLAVSEQVQGQRHIRGTKHQGPNYIYSHECITDLPALLFFFFFSSLFSCFERLRTDLFNDLRVVFETMHTLNAYILFVHLDFSMAHCLKLCLVPTLDTLSFL